MKQSIIPGEVLILHDPNEEELISEPESRKPWKLKATALIMGYTAFVSIDNAAHYYDTAKINADDGSMVEDVKGCDALPTVAATVVTNPPTFITLPEYTPEQIQSTIEVEEMFADTKSSASNFTPKPFNIAEFGVDWWQIHRNEIAQFRSEYSGLNVSLFSDGNENPFENIDLEVVDSLIHSSLSPNITYDHIGVNALAACMRYRFIDDNGPRELEDRLLNIYIPDKPGVCFSNKLVQEIPNGAEYNDFCDSSGATFENVRLAVRPFYEYNRSWMVLMSSRTAPDSVNSSLSKMFTHEPIHYLTQVAGLPFRYTPNERLVVYMQSQVQRQAYHDKLPISITYPNKVYEQFSEK